jgi:uncharacterized protein (TIGR03083 family)
MTTSTLSRTRTSALSREASAVLARTENARFADLLGSLQESDWERPTDCPAWDVREIAIHVLGAMEGHVRMREMVHQLRLARSAAGDGPLVDGMTAVQVRERHDLRPAQIVEQVGTIAPRAAAARSARPALMRMIPFPQEVGESTEWWTLGYLLDAVLTRDVWMHRVDISRAVGRPLELTAEHDGRLVADVVHDWGRRHGQPFHLRLTGPAGGEFTVGTGGEDLEEDAVEFCRILSGRATGDGLLSHPVPF